MQRNALQKWGIFLLTVTAGAVILCGGLTLIGFGNQTEARETDALVEIIDKALLQAYALEGAYPDSLTYLAENYGIILKEDTYYYYYEPVGANIFPTVQVIKK